MRIRFTDMTENDLPEVMKLERETFTAPWSRRMFVEELERGFSSILLAWDGEDSLAGFINYWVLLGEAHILNVAVRVGSRRMGVGRALVSEALRRAKIEGATAATLEVREKNAAAMRLYEKFGFERAGLRPGYYDKPVDNAVIMWLYDIDAALIKTP